MKAFLTIPTASAWAEVYQREGSGVGTLRFFDRKKNVVYMLSVDKDDWRLAETSFRVPISNDAAFVECEGPIGVRFPRVHT